MDPALFHRKKSHERTGPRVHAASYRGPCYANEKRITEFVGRPSLIKVRFCLALSLRFYGRLPHLRAGVYRPWPFCSCAEKFMSKLRGILGEALRKPRGDEARRLVCS